MSEDIKRNNEDSLLTIIIPLYNEADSLVILSEQIKNEISQIYGNRWDVLFIDDGSTDMSFAIIKDIIEKDSTHFNCIRFRRNLGKSAALAVGFSYASGRYVATMDADLQDDPKEFKKMAKMLDDGWDLVSGWKAKRYDPVFSKNIPSKLFNFITSVSSGIKLHDFNCGIKMYKHEVIETLDVYGEMHRYLPALAHWNGFRVTETPVEHHERQFGKSKFGLSRFIRGFLDLLTVVFTTRYLKRPMHFFGLFGTLFSLVGLGIFVYLCVQWLLGDVYLSQRPLAWVSMGIIIIGVQFFSIGLIGELLVKQSFKKDAFKNLIKEKSF